MKYSAIKYFCTVNGDGIFTSVFVSGCDLRCNGCFNEIAWDFEKGKEVTDEIIEKILKSIEPEYITGLSILGGEPLAMQNCQGVKNIITKCREKFGKNKQIWLWSGRYLKELNDVQLDVISQCDYFIDGRFDARYYDMNLRFRGSSNQTIWENNNGIWEKSKYN